MKLVIDTREQAPLKFFHPLVKDITKTCLKVGDYGAWFADDYMFPVVFERKSLGDLFGTLSQGYERFKKEIMRAKEKGFRIIIAVEVPKERVLLGYVHSQRNGVSIVIQLNTLKERYGVDTVFCKGRVHMANHIAEYYLAHYKEWKERGKDAVLSTI